MPFGGDGSNRGGNLLSEATVKTKHCPALREKEVVVAKLNRWFPRVATVAAVALGTFVMTAPFKPADAQVYFGFDGGGVGVGIGVPMYGPGYYGYGYGYGYPGYGYYHHHRYGYGW